MNNALNVFENDKRIWSVSGYTPPVKFPKDYDRDIYLLPRSVAWGFGTWADRWNAVDFNRKTDYKSIVNDPQKKKIICSAGEDILGTIQKHPNSYGIPIYYYMRMNDKYSVVPTRSLVQNIGCDSTGEHFTRQTNKYSVELYHGEIRIDTAVEPSPAIIGEIKKFYSKPWYRKAAIYAVKKLGMYDFLLKRFG